MRAPSPLYPSAPPNGNGGPDRAALARARFDAYGPIGYHTAPMNAEHKFRLERLRVYLGLMTARITRGQSDADAIEIIDPAAERLDAPPDKGDWHPITIGADWGGKQQWAWFRGSLTAPANWTSGALELRLRHDARYLEYPNDDNFAAGPEGQAFINRQRVGAIDQAHHRVRHPFEPGKSYDARAVFFAARCTCRHTLAEFGLAWIDTATEKLYHDLRVALEIIEQLDETNIARERLLRAVEAAIAELDVRELPASPAVPAEFNRDPGHERFYASIPAAQRAFDERITAIPPAGDVPTIVCVGHAHIDLAWLWPIRQTKHKCVRTFASQVRLIDQYPGYVFQQSSPQAYAWIEAEAPDLFAQIKERIEKGGWEADGATWCEMDTNVTGGESLVRQLLYGKRYLRDKLGIDSRMLWLPDVFGYSAALPQILRLAGVTTFVTQKISWSQYNRFPFQTFRWRGIDGSEVATHFPLNTYNGLTTGKPVREIKEQWDAYLHKPLLAEPLLPFGWGDGGGGPTEEILETTTRIERMPAVFGLPRVRHGKAGDLLKQIEARAAELPVWDGELYLEYHRGTYTTQAWLKRANRKNEIRLHNAEWLAALAGPLGFALDKPKLDACWQNLMLMQFHDILPGSSVGEVYEETRPMQEQIAREVDAMIDAAAACLAERIDTSAANSPVVLFNTLSWERSDPIRMPDNTWRDDMVVPPCGWTVVDAAHRPEAEEVFTIEDDGRSIESPFWRIRLDDDGAIRELYDRLAERHVLAPHARANLWQVFEDRPMNFDAWDIDLYYEQKPLPGPQLQSVSIVEKVPARAAVEMIWRMQAIGSGPPSTITQRLAVYANHPRIDFETDIEWHEHHQLLKVAFPVSVRATEATHEIQFGHLRRPTHRNTSWDLARFEVCAHRWVDVSEHGYGVALLNDCKYGHDVHDNVIRLTCIKSPQAPDARADQGRHTFTYALLPHQGPLQDAGVIQAAAELNTPVIARSVDASHGELPPGFTFVHCETEGVVIDTIKPAEDGDGLILRLYESHGAHARAVLAFASPPQYVQAVNLLEEAKDSDIELRHESCGLSLSLRPFQIVTLRVHA